MYDGGVKREQSEFNSSVAYLNRINTEFSMAIEAAITLDAYTWFYCLLAIFRELSTEMNKDEMAWFKEKKVKINEMLSKFSRNNEAQLVMIKPELQEELENFELELRRIFKDSGLQQKVQDDAANALK